METFDNIVQEVLTNLEGASGVPETYVTLQDTIAANTATIDFDNAVYPDGSGIGVGVVEAGDELISLINISATNPTTMVATADRVIRGFRGTTAAAHNAGTIVRVNPKLTRQQVKRAINDTITSLHPRLPVIRSHEFTYTGNTTRYALPADALNIMLVSYNPPGSTKQWVPIRRWSFSAEPTSLDAGMKAIEIYEAFPSRKIQVIYQASPVKLAADADLFTSTGLPDWARDIVVYGACHRLAVLMDTPKISMVTAEQSMMNSRGAYGSASIGSGAKLSQYFYGLYQARLTEAEARLQDQFPVSRHYIR